MGSIDKLDEMLSSFFKNEIDGSSLLSFLYCYLKKKTHGGKLYKYRQFDKDNYALDSLKKQYLYCAAPGSFNDPFDCRMGMNITSLMDALIHNGTDNIDLKIGELEKVLSQNVDCDSCESLNQSDIDAIMNNKGIFNFINEIRDKKLTNIELLYVIQKYINEFSVLLEILFKDNKYLDGKMKKDDVYQFVSILKPDKAVFKNNTLDIIPSLSNSLGIKDDVDEITSTKLIAQEITPEFIDNAIEMDNQFSIVDKDLHKIFSENYHIGCLCSDYKNRLMWSHYAANHTGFCIEYDLSKLESNVSKVLILPVLYSRERPLIPWNSILNKNINYTYELQLIHFLITKDSIWSYEKEWRILLLNKQQNNKVELPVSCIYVGTECNKENRLELQRIAKEINVPIMEMKMDRG